MQWLVQLSSSVTKPRTYSWRFPYCRNRTGYLSWPWITARRMSKCLRHTSITLAPTRMLLKLSPATFSNFVLLFSIVTHKYQKATQIHVSLIILRIYFICGPGKLSRYSDTLRDGRSGDRNLLEAIFSAPVQTGPGDHPASYTMGTGSLPGVKPPGRDADHPSHLPPRLKKE